MTSRIACTTTLSLLLAATATACGDDGGAGGTDAASSDTTATTTNSSTSPTSPTSPTTNPTTGPTSTDPTMTTDPTSSTTEDPTDTEDPDTGSESTGNTLDCPYTPIEGTDDVGLELVADGFNIPLHVVGDPVDKDVLYVVQKAGAIKRIEPGVTSAPAEDWLNVDVVNSNNDERGLLSLAFHPDYETNGLIYTASTPTGLGGAVYVTEYSVTDGVVDTESARLVIGVDEPFSNHNGGQVAFGPDGMLYLGMGDGGSGGDPCNAGQDGNTALGKILRIDPTADGTPDSTPACPGGGGCNCASESGFDYTIPADNPFVGDDSIIDEAFITGVRNPWRFSFDPVDGTLFIADVGQGGGSSTPAQEEVNVGEAGDNLGWNTMEGLGCYDGQPCTADAEPGGYTSGKPSMRAPLASYGHGGGRCSITGLGVYRSCEVPELDGRYFYSDLCTGEVFSLAYDGTNIEEHGVVATTPNLAVYGGGTNAYGDVFVAAAPGQGGPGAVYRVTAGR